MTYLVVRFSTLGTVAMLVPVLCAVAERYSGDTFVVITDKPLNALFAEVSNIKVVVRNRAVSSRHLTNQLIDTYAVDAVLDLQDSFDSRLLRFYMRLKRKPVYVIKKERWRRRALIRKGYQHSEPLLTEFQLYERTFMAAGLKVDNMKVPAYKSKVNDKLFGLKIEGEQWIGVAPFATHRTNMLPRLQIKELLAYLSKRQNTEIYLFGAGEVECEVLDQWETIYDNTRSVAGKLPLESELALMKQLDLMVCMDSANQHLSSLVGLPALTIWCGTHPYAGFYGWNQPAENIVQKQLSCRPCTLHGAERCKKKTFECQTIEAQEIIDKIENLLSKSN